MTADQFVGCFLISLSLIVPIATHLAYRRHQ